MDFIVILIIIGVFLLLLIKFKVIFIFFMPYMKKYFLPSDLSGPGGHRYITDVKQQLVDFDLDSLSSLVDVQYDKSVNFRVAGIISDYKTKNRSLLSFYGDFIYPKLDDTPRQNKLLGPLKAITSKDQMELYAENNSFKLHYNKNHIASITSGTRRILNPSGQEIGFIEGPEYKADCNLSEIDSNVRKVVLQGEEIAKYRGLFFSTEENKKFLSDKSIFQSIKPGLTEFQLQFLTFLVTLDIYYNSVYYFQKKS
ncbi:MAG TPA: hypothetical protein PL110_14780 [Candidatus Eremiobacteraeota bacterium]|nr:hypothetical protein [Candidatus Eremiobacteraeota bacterium]